LGAWYLNAKPLPKPWRTALKAAEALPPDADDLATYSHHTGRERWPSKPAKRLIYRIGRRGLKSSVAADIAAHEATCRDHSAYLPPGTVGVVMVAAADKAQATTIKGYILAKLEASPIYSRMIASVTAERILLSNNVAIEVHTSNFRRIRGRTVLCAVADEICFWPSDEDSAVPDREWIRAIEPAMLTVPTAKLVVISSPYRPVGVMFDLCERYFGRDDLGDETLVWFGTSTEMCPWLDKEDIARRKAEDPEGGLAEFGDDWRRDRSDLYAQAWLDASVDRGVIERTPQLDLYRYQIHADISGGRRDPAGVGVSTKTTTGKATLCYVEEIKPPCDPTQVIARFAQVAKKYGATLIRGDDYAANFVVAEFQRHGISYVQPVLNDERWDTSRIFLESVTLMSGGHFRLLDNERLLRQLAALERRTRSGGRDSAGHGPGGHDDLSVAAIGSLLFAHRDSCGLHGNEVIVGQSTLFDGYMRNVEPERPASPFDRYTDPPGVLNGLRGL
jgi:hypothetical protein